MLARLAASTSVRGFAVVAMAGLLAALLAAFGEAAAAGDDLGIRRNEFWPWAESAAVSSAMPVVTAPLHRRARRIWAASHTRPLRIALDRRRSVGSVSARSGRPRLARRLPVLQPPVVFARRITLPKPPRTALVSVFQDTTLRNGDAVMMADGIHVFHGAGVWPLRPRDFVRLQLVASLDWHLRQTLDGLDRNPPTRWTSIDTSSG